MAYVRIRTLLNECGEDEYDAVAYTDEDALGEFGEDLDSLATEKPARGESVVRRVDWDDDKVARFNEVGLQYYQLVMDAVVEVGL